MTSPNDSLSFLIDDLLHCAVDHGDNPRDFMRDYFRRQILKYITYNVECPIIEAVEARRINAKKNEEEHPSLAERKEATIRRAAYECAVNEVLRLAKDR